MSSSAIVDPHNIIIPSTERTYKSGDSAGTVRFKFALLAIVQSALAPIQLIFGHLADLASGGWYRRGTTQADLLVKSPHLQRTIELAKTVVKIILFPLFIAAREVLSLVGLFATPMTARNIYGQMEHMMAVNQNGIEHEERYACDFTDYSAPCMQTEQNWKQRVSGRMHSPPDSDKNRQRRLKTFIRRGVQKGDLTLTQGTALLNAVKEQQSKEVLDAALATFHAGADFDKLNNALGYI
ncbi:MAG: hypothetical protein MRY21_04200 [Simkaniaceae bacterium]|nr:hypothetical protein [Simkaniaceae bacterium]